MTAAELLFVCSGNACRSVLAEAVARHLLAGTPAADLRVGSAGLRAVAGAPADPSALVALAEVGVSDVDLPRGGARPLVAPLVARADLVLTATAGQRDRVVALWPAASRRVFILREFARIAAHLPPDPLLSTVDDVDRVRTVVAAVAGLRGQVGYVGPTGDDIIDPVRRPAAVRACAQLVVRAVTASLAVLIPPAGTTRPTPPAGSTRPTPQVAPAAPVTS